MVFSKLISLAEQPDERISSFFEMILKKFEAAILYADLKIFSDPFRGPKLILFSTRWATGSVRWNVEDPAE